MRPTMYCLQIQRRSQKTYSEIGTWRYFRKEEKDGFYQFMDQYDKWDTTPYTPVADNNMGSSHTSKSELGNKSIKSDFYIGERQS